jgi:glycosyltransferase involved in cell wall biosynthesis
LLVQRLYRKCAAGISLTQYGKKEAEALGISRTEVIPLDFVDSFQEDKVQRCQAGPVHLLCLGHICEEKGIPLLLQSVRTCLDQGFVLRLTLAGDCLQPCTEKILKEWIRQLGLEAEVEWKGCVEGTEKAALLGQADLLLFPSLASESFGIVMVEGMMWGLPVLALNRRANNEVLCGPPADLQAESAEALPRQLAAVLGKRELWLDWGRQNREKFLRHYLRPTGSSKLIRYLAHVARKV